MDLLKFVVSLIIFFQLLYVFISASSGYSDGIVLGISLPVAAIAAWFLVRPKLK